MRLFSFTRECHAPAWHELKVNMSCLEELSMKAIS
ncbi:MAG TPA: hypothetical protein DEB17_09430 [Chlorobaculum sp.]|uniref:Uncharacterized protein n=1 Tax=Chlorobaculum tepidum (strain ATCC 49652 / DSM 12025 / NBRC 103806 / TLS) TaxID=194439 RepID=Q8KBD0_CHLTE|nr:hypothetical protein CT1858 [Chlorobaculum tepidum TLS]HBU24189.1 hypothetical protein [Chlorobaculum sp.]